MRLGWERRFLETPLTVVGRSKAEGRRLTEAHRRCKAENMPFAYFQRSGKIGLYACDLINVEGWRPRDLSQFQAAVGGMFGGFMSRWELDGRLPRGTTVSYGGWDRPSIYPVPAGEERYIHHALCRLLAQHLEPNSRRRATA